MIINVLRSGLIALMTMTAFAATASAGGEIGNGGDSVFCRADTKSPFSGYYSLDFLLTLKSDSADVIGVKSWSQSRARLETLLAKKFPDLAVSFADFAARIPQEDTIPSQDQYIHRRIWDEAPYGLVDISDERMIRKLPENCYQLVSAAQIQLIQTVIRRKKSDVTIYDYDPDIMLKELKEKAPLQFSYLMVHEWLWDLTDDVDVIRRANRFLHSKIADQLPPDQFLQSVENIGISFRARTIVPVCERTPEIRKALETVFRQPCDKITDFDPKKMPGDYPQSTSLVMNKLGIRQIWPGDFSGLGSTYHLYLNDNPLNQILDDSFFGLYALKELHLSGAGLREFNAKSLRNLPALTNLNLSKNQLRRLPTGVFENICRHQEMQSLWYDFSQNPLEEIDLTPAIECFLKSTSYGVHIKLTDTPLTAKIAEDMRNENSDLNKALATMPNYKKNRFRIEL